MMKKVWNLLSFTWHEFECRLGLLRPNQTTIEAIEAGERGEVFRLQTREDLLRDLNNDDEE